VLAVGWLTHCLGPLRPFVRLPRFLPLAPPEGQRRSPDGRLVIFEVATAVDSVTAMLTVAGSAATARVLSAEAAAEIVEVAAGTAAGTAVPVARRTAGHGCRLQILSPVRALLA